MQYDHKKESRYVIGIDIVRSGGTNLKDYVYVIALVKDGNVKKVEEGGLGRLVRLLWEYRPSKLAVDNILELGGNKRNLFRILKFIPPDCDIVQVTMDEGIPITLKRVATKAGLSLEAGKLNPTKTAIALALLAEKDLGDKLTVFEKKVKILVSRGRVPGSGGSRSDKYQRSIRGAVSRMVKKIREELDKKGFDYDLMIRRSRGGVEGAVFVVYADRKDLYGVVSKEKGHDVEVRIRPVISRRLLKTISKDLQKKYLIVGFDPGIEAGLAAIDLDMNPVIITSGKRLDRGEVLSILSTKGITVMVATDKNPPPDMVKKLAATLGAQLYVPPRSMTTSEKELIVSDYSRNFALNIRNTHERDALAAALKAYKNFEEKFRKLSDKVRNIGIRIRNIQDYRVRLLKNEPVSSIIEDIISDYLTDSRRTKESAKVRMLVRATVDKELESKVKELEGKLWEMTLEKERLLQRMKELEKESIELRTELNILTSELSKDIYKDRKVSEIMHRLKTTSNYIMKLESELNQLKNKLAGYERLIEKIYRGDLTLVRVIKHASIEEIRKCENMIGKIRKGETILLMKGTDEIEKEFIDYALNKDLTLILPPGCHDLASKLVRMYELPAASVDTIEMVGEHVCIVPKTVIHNLRKMQQDIMRQRQKKKSLTEEDLLKIVDEYRRRALETNHDFDESISKN